MTRIPATTAAAFFLLIAISAPAQDRQDPGKSQPEASKSAPAKAAPAKPAPAKAAPAPARASAPARAENKAPAPRAAQPASAKAAPAAPAKAAPAAAKSAPERTSAPAKAAPVAAKSAPEPARAPAPAQQHAAQGPAPRPPQRSNDEVAQQRAQPALRISVRNNNRIPDARFQANFGRAHTFRIGTPTLVGGYSRFQYGGVSFGFLQPWPVGWYYTDQVYVVYDQGGYFLMNPFYPTVRVSISVVL